VNLYFLGLVRVQVPVATDRTPTSKSVRCRSLSFLKVTQRVCSKELLLQWYMRSHKRPAQQPTGRSGRHDDRQVMTTERRRCAAVTVQEITTTTQAAALTSQQMLHTRPARARNRAPPRRSAMGVWAPRAWEGGEGRAGSTALDADPLPPFLATDRLLSHSAYAA
jgi:hypothetical protein